MSSNDTAIVEEIRRVRAALETARAKLGEAQGLYAHCCEHGDPVADYDWCKMAEMDAMEPVEELEFQLDKLRERHPDAFEQARQQYPALFPQPQPVPVVESKEDEIPWWVYHMARGETITRDMIPEGEPLPPSNMPGFLVYPLAPNEAPQEWAEVLPTADWPVVGGELEDQADSPLGIVRRTLRWWSGRRWHDEIGIKVVAETRWSGGSSSEINFYVAVSADSTRNRMALTHILGFLFEHTEFREPYFGGCGDAVLAIYPEDSRSPTVTVLLCDDEDKARTIFLERHPDQEKVLN